MKKAFLIIIFYSFIPFGLSAQLALIVEIQGLRNNTGNVYIELSNENEEHVIGVTKNITDNKCIIFMDNLQSKKYSFKFFHDENKNKELDTNWLGIPKEGFGFSNNPSMTFGPPSFDKTIFDLNESIVIVCKPKYF